MADEVTGCVNLREREGTGGVYIVKLRTGKFIETKKMVLLK